MDALVRLLLARPARPKLLLQRRNRVINLDAMKAGSSSDSEHLREAEDKALARIKGGTASRQTEPEAAPTGSIVAGFEARLNAGIYSSQGLDPPREQRVISEARSKVDQLMSISDDQPPDNSLQMIRLKTNHPRKTFKL